MKQIEIIESLCEITETLSSLVKEMNREIQQSNIADDIGIKLTNKVEECDERVTRILGEGLN
ncbi:MAG: hypothetical protein PHX08_01735 [Lachnospiraceae bacterium]|nr:hypothetical protein [Lachnospiraceae bacterium]